MAEKFYQYNQEINETNTFSITLPGHPVITGTWAHIMDQRKECGQLPCDGVVRKQTAIVILPENETPPNLYVDGIGWIEPNEFGGRRPDGY